MDKRTESMIVFCIHCNAPGKVLFDRVSNRVVKSHFACKCDRVPAEKEKS